MVFADSFVRSEEVRKRNLKYWNDWMIAFGLSKEQVDIFHTNNQDMLHTATEELLQQAAKESGFSEPKFNRIPGTEEDTPFQLLVMHRA